MTTYQIVAVVAAATAILVCILLAVIGRNKHNTTKEIVYGAICIALSFALSYARLFKLPQGGSVTFASLVPLAFYSYKFGWQKGVMIGCIYGLLQSIQDPWIVHPLQYVLDYPLAFAFIGLSGILKKTKLQPRISAPLGFLLACIGRYLCHAVSGAVYFGSYGADFGVGAWAWGFLYNAFVWADAAIAATALAIMFSSGAVRRLASDEPA